MNIVVQSSEIWFLSYSKSTLIMIHTVSARLHIAEIFQHFNSNIKSRRGMHLIRST